MEAVLEVEQAEEATRLTSLDEPKGCRLCNPTDTATGRQQLAAIAQWWLSAEQRRAWGVETFIEGRQRDDRKAMDAIFKIRHPRRSLPIFVFYILIQHLEDKKPPHYQLQISFSSGSMGLAGEEPDLVAQVERLFDRACEQTEGFRYKRLKSISLHEELPPTTVAAIREAISNLVQGLVTLTW